MIGTAINNSITKNWLDTLERGTIFAYPSNVKLPSGTLICDGSSISRTTYAELFAVIGTTYGAGNGSTTFNIPNLYHQVPFMFTGIAIGERYFGRLPNITGSFRGGDTYSGANMSGAFYDQNKSGDSKSYHAEAGKEFREVAVAFNASRSSSAYNTDTTFGSNAVIPRSLSMVYVIKY